MHNIRKHFGVDKREKIQCQIIITYLTLYLSSLLTTINILSSGSGKPIKRFFQI